MRETHRMLSLLASCLVMLVAGTLATYSLISESLRKTFKLSMSEINLISAVGNTALYVTFIVIGPFYDKFGPRMTMYLATILVSLGYILLWLSYQHLIDGSTISLSLYFFLVGAGSNAGYMASLGVCAVNYTKKVSGIVVGTLLLFYGISGTVYSQIFAGLFPTDVKGFVLTLATTTFAVNLLGSVFVERVPLGTLHEEHPLLQDGPSPQTPDAPVIPRRQSVNLTPTQMLRSSSFWIYLFITIWAQGLCYMSNVTTIIIAILGPTATEAQVATQSALQITLISVAQSIGRLFFSAISDVVVQRLKIDRSILLLLANLIATLPLLLLSMSGIVSMTTGLLAFCSVCVGLGFGALGGLFPLLTKDFFGTQFYGTACSFLLSPVPIGILASNIIFSSFYNLALDGSDCFGPKCYSSATQVLLAIQILVLLLSMILFYQRSHQKLT
ncbi:major facilitator superfamily domain-containing protein [Gorgonomyces haynaldii]|nr:major facilitator superfamily domain-containing protein [Gorgonomyces haynaldii]